MKVNSSIESMESTYDGTTWIDFANGTTVELSGKAAAELCEHLMRALDVSITLGLRGPSVTVAPRTVPADKKATVAVLTADA